MNRGLTITIMFLIVLKVMHVIMNLVKAYCVLDVQLVDDDKISTSIIHFRPVFEPI